MRYSFKIWNQPSTGSPMALRIRDVRELDRLSRGLPGSDALGVWDSLRDYLAATAVATAPTRPFSRFVDVLWELAVPAPPSPYIQDRVFHVLYSGGPRAAGGFASQGYCALDPAWATSLQPYHRTELIVDVYPGGGRDLFVVRNT
jgi:hypothetical protein